MIKSQCKLSSKSSRLTPNGLFDKEGNLWDYNNPALFHYWEILQDSQNYLFVSDDEEYWNWWPFYTNAPSLYNCYKLICEKWGTK